MNVYDFDGTIYHGDSSRDFFLFSLKKHPSLLKYVPRQFKGFFLHYVLKKIDKTEMKEHFFSFLEGIDVKSALDEFWSSHFVNIYDWYPKQHRDDDIIISASPEFLLRPACKRLKIANLIASDVDALTGKFNSENCRDEEKVKRLYSAFGNVKINSFYSDSNADLPLARIAENAFLIKNGSITKWEL